MSVPSMSRRAKRTAAACMVVAAVVGGGIAVALPAEENSDDNTIHGCVSRGLLGIGAGSIRIVEEPSQCRRSEDALSWNQQGVPGATGPQGPAGPA
ncbi:MAG: hypothetical protein ACRD0U_20140, partial [Acidimicrobiales bacterium]